MMMTFSGFYEHTIPILTFSPIFKSNTCSFCHFAAERRMIKLSAIISVLPKFKDKYFWVKGGFGWTIQSPESIQQYVYILYRIKNFSRIILKPAAMIGPHCTSHGLPVVLILELCCDLILWRFITDAFLNIWML